MTFARPVVLAIALLLVFTARAYGQEDLDADVAPSADAGPPPDASVAGEAPGAVAPPPAEQPAEDGLAQLAGSPCAVEDIRNLAAYRGGPAATGAKVSGYTLRPSGDLLESEKVLRPVLDSMILGQAWDEKRERCLVGLLARLSYRLDGPIRGQQKDGGFWLTLPIHPAVVVRSVSFDDYYPRPARGFIDFFRYPRSYLFQPILRSELTVHTKLRAGLILPDDEETRAHFLSAEARELEAWLGRQGLFDAEVKVATHFGEREHEIRLVVTVLAGHSYRVGNVRIIGNKAIPRARILEIFQPRDSVFCWIGYQCRFSKDKLNRDVERLRRLYQGVGFPAVRVTTDFDPSTSPDRSRRKVDFTVNIKEGRRLEYLFEGNDWAGKDDLESELTFNENGAADDEEAQSSADAVRNFYQRNGFFQALVTWTRVTRVPRVFDRIVFGVVEGPRLRVASVTYKGNTSISTERLDTATVTSTWRRYSDGGYLTTRQLTQDAESIREVYLAEGFSEVVVTPRAAMHPDLLDAPGALAAASTGASGNGELHVRFDIEEGERDVVAAVDFVGNSAIPAATLAGAVELAPGKPYSSAQLAEDVASLQTFYAGRGYAYVEIQAAAPRPDDHRFRVRFTISEGKPIRAGKVIARGNFVTRRWVIRTVLGLAEDEQVTVADLRTGQEALRSSGLFQSVNLELIGLTPEQRWERVHALVTVQERYDDLVSFEANGGYSDVYDFFVGGGVEFMNIGGIGLSLEGTGQIGSNGYLNLQGTGRAPWWIARRFLRLPARFSPDVSLTYNQREEVHPRFGDLEQKIWILSLSRQVTRRWYASLRGEWARKDLYEDLVRGPGATEELEQTPIDFDIATFGATVIYDARTDLDGNPTPIGATDGWKLTLYGELATDVFLGSESFVKAGGAFVKPTSFGKGRGVFTFGLRHDYGYPLDGTVLPETERFFAGGDLTLRGYEEGRAFTEIIRAPLPGGGEVLTVEEAGGNLRTLANFDLEIRVCNCIGGLPLATALFFDSGVVSNSWNELRGGDAWEPFFSERVRYSVGLALARIITPVISASLEYAIPINPGIGDDQTGRVHINFGFVVN